MTAAVLELEQVTYAYPGPARARPALAEVTVSVRAGELVVVAGASGSGKSTLLGIACGLVPHFRGGTFAGRARVAGLDTRHNGPPELSSRVGTVLQDPETQIVMGTVRAELGFGLENRGRPAAEVARAVEEVALALGIEPLLERATAELSGGELQRVALAAALAGRPPLLVLDEPTSQLDPVAGDELIALLRRVNQDLDTTILLSEHRLERCLFAADRVLVLDQGRIACDADPAGFLAWAGRCAPRLQTPGARLLELAGVPPAAGVKAARAALRARQLLPDPASAAAPPALAPQRRFGRRRPRGAAAEPPAVALDHVWHELQSGPAVLRDVNLMLRPRERVALMGANGAGKSTLLRHAAGLVSPTRGKVRRAGRVALLLQNPNDYLVHETVAAEAPLTARAAVGLGDAGLAQRHPRELSGGERQRLALAVVLGEHPERAAAVCLDEPTRGMDRDHRDSLTALLKGTNAAVLVATHDPEFVAAFAQRVVLLAAGAVIADGPAGDVLASGIYFATETARILGGAGGALTPEAGASLLRSAGAPAGVSVTEEVAM